jgi:hypothetical protein
VLKAEKETVFRWDSEEQIVHIFTCHPRVWRRLERKDYTPVESHVRGDREVARSYRVPLSCFRYGFRAADQPRRPAPTGAFRSKKPETTTRQ